MYTLIRNTQAGKTSTTQISCVVTMGQEAAYLAALPATASWSIEGDDLWLRDADGAALAHYVAR